MTDDRIDFNGMRVLKTWPEQVAKAQQTTYYTIGDTAYPRLKFGEEPSGEWGADEGRACHDCAVMSGQFHVPGCDVEACPACGGQVIGCGCAEEKEEL